MIGLKLKIRKMPSVTINSVKTKYYLQKVFSDI